MLPHQPDISAVVNNISNSLSSGNITQSQAELLHTAFGDLEYCSIGVYVKDYGTVITTDNMVNAGFVDLSLCPLRMSMVGCVISRGMSYHDNVSTHRNGLPLDITRAVQRYGIKCAACIPIKLAAVISGDTTVASERILGTLMLGSCKLNGVSVEHRNIAESVAAALAPSFADATSNMYNNITDYVLGPMHGKPYPITSQRPLLNHLTDLQDGCRSGDSDHSDEDPACSQAQPVTEADSCNMDSSDYMGPSILSRVDPDSVSTLASGPAVLFQPPESQPSMASASSQFTLDNHAHSPTSQARPKSSSELKGRPNVLKGGASPQALGLEDSSADDDDVGYGDDAHDSGSDDDDDDDDDVDDEHAPMLRRRLLNSAGGEAEGQSRQSGDRRSSGFSFLQTWRKGKRAKSDDSAQENHYKGAGSEGPAGNSPEAETKAQGPVKAFAAVSYTQHKLRLNFMDARVERRYCVWQAEQRTKLQLLYTLVIIATATCVGYITPPQERGPLLTWPPFLQLLPLITLSIDPNRYYRNSEWMHILLNITKTVWAVCFGVPRQSPFWTPGRRLAIAWKFGIDSLMISGLGELGRFSTFLWVQALDLVIVVMRSGGMCSTSIESDLSTQQCVVLVVTSNFLVTYLFAGSLVWYMDKLARDSFVQQQQHVSIDAAAA